MITTVEFIFIMVLFTALAVYGFLVLMFASGWIRIPGFRQDHGKSSPLKVSVVVALRNEEPQVRRLMDQLRIQDHGKDLFEVIVVDDHSEDGTWGAVQAWIAENKGFPARAFSLSEGSGKKKALYAGITEATGDIILTTDADCTFASRWVRTFAVFVETTGARMTFGPVLPHPGNTFADKFQELEFMSLMGSGAGASGAGRPFLCNGANLAFRREDFFEVGGYDSHFRISSGDDVFLLHTFKEYFGNDSIRFLKAKEALVMTPLQPGIASFFNQRKRWASKSFHYRDIFAHTVGLSVFLMNFLLLASFLSFIWGMWAGLAGIAALFLKGFVDLMLLGRVARFAGRKGLLYLLPLFEVMYIVYATLAALLSLLSPYEWKGRVQKI